MPESGSVSTTSQNSEVARPATSSADDRHEYAHALLFTGHMIDSADRAQPRFPRSAEKRARQAIREAIAAVAWTRPGSTIALAGGASGGDLLFHECCEELGIPTRVLLALPPDKFEAASVAPAGRAWVDRFHALLKKLGPGRAHLMESVDGLLEGETENIWQRANLWMIEEATAIAAEQALLALWDGKTGDGPGGTEHFLQVARQAGIHILPVISMQSLLDPES
jgi:hypothetical protein